MSILAVLVGISLMFPAGKVTVAEDYTLRWGSIDDFLAGPGKGPKTDISAIVSTLQESPPKVQQPDVVHIHFEDSAGSAVARAVRQPYFSGHTQDSSVARTKVPIEYRDSSSSALAPFFERLLTIQQNKKPLRIIHYGDSQIEGDRISGVVRQHFQHQFGGSGPGFVSVYEEQGFASPVVYRHRGDWQRYARYGQRDSSVWHSNYGHMLSFARFSPLAEDAAPSPSDIRSASVRIQTKEKTLFPLRSAFRSIDIYYAANRHPFFVEIYKGDSLLHLAGGRVGKGVQKISYRSSTALSECTLSLTGADSPDIYGVALDDTAGITVDNIPMRGSSGLEFAQVASENMAQIVRSLDVGLIILQYGVNVVPTLRKNYAYYRTAFAKQIRYLQKIYPHVPILVISLSDMTAKEGDDYVSFPNIEMIRDAQRAAAFDCGCAFWDLYKAMGGYNSMFSWVQADPPLARKDCTHFNYLGAQLVGNMLYRAVIDDFNDYISSTVIDEPAQPLLK